jgi:hypothetical protein
LYLFSCHQIFFRFVSLLTALAFLSTSVQAWHFLPAAYAGGGSRFH